MYCLSLPCVSFISLCVCVCVCVCACACVYGAHLLVAKLQDVNNNLGNFVNRALTFCTDFFGGTVPALVSVFWVALAASPYVVQEA